MRYMTYGRYMGWWCKALRSLWELFRPRFITLGIYDLDKAYRIMTIRMADCFFQSSPVFDKLRQAQIDSGVTVATGCMHTVEMEYGNEDGWYGDE